MNYFVYPHTHLSINDQILKGDIQIKKQDQFNISSNPSESKLEEPETKWTNKEKQHQFKISSNPSESKLQEPETKRSNNRKRINLKILKTIRI